MPQTQQSLGNIRETFFSELSHLYDHRELNSLFQLICDKIWGLSPAQIVLQKSKNYEFAKLETLLKRMKQGLPVQYALGLADFCGMELYVNPSVLIPRPETEELVSLILKENHLSSPKIMDIGTGSGCIPIALKKGLTSSEVHAIDISSDALDVASKNAVKQGVDVSFNQDNILTSLTEYPLFDIIVSNPPYVPEKDKNSMENQVLNHEPYVALFVADDDPLLFYRTIGEWAKKQLKPGGRLYFEIHRDYAEENKKLAESQGFQEVKILKDLNDNWRMLRAETAVDGNFSHPIKNH